MEKINLFCLPFAGGSAYSYQIFNVFKPSFINLIPIELPGRGRRIRENLLTDIPPMVEDYYTQIAGRLSEPYAIYGHSMGALLGLKLTERLSEKNHPPPLHLFLSGRAAPSVVDPERKKRYLMPKNEFIEKIRELDGSPEEVLKDDELMNFFEPILRADFQAIETYNHYQKANLPTPIDVFIGSEEKITIQEAYRWQEETTANVDVKVLSGKHFFIYKQTKYLFESITERLSNFN